MIGSPPFLLVPRRTFILALATLLAACGDTAKLPVEAGIGPEPVLPPPDSRLFPTVNIAPARGWPNGETPTAAEGTEVVAFAGDLDHPRWLFVLPNGDVLVAETNRPPKQEKGFRDYLAGWFMSRAGAGGDSADRITLLRDTDGDGVADQRSVFLDELHSPFGMALVDGWFYVANADALVRFPYEEGADRITEAGETVTALPGGPINHHWTKSLIASPDGSSLYVGVGSNSNVGENGLDKEEGRAAIWKIDRESDAAGVFASGLRNPVGMAWEPETGVLWTAVNERDEIGSDLVPDYMTSVNEGDFYGWPYSYYGQILDTRVQPQKPDLVRTARVPDYALGAHTASLGLSNAEGNRLPARFSNGMFVGQHGSWNRKPHSGYKVIFVPFEDGRPSGPPLDLLTGFLSPDKEALGRPVGVAVDTAGGLLVADDVGDIVWRVSKARDTD
ncbi:MAG: sorbosone dehydrogenase family protein [Oleiphilaceae bacterium]|nr:sorbosone dehydrogenase family protein [Oleiphilaceae bacterium]